MNSGVSCVWNFRSFLLSE